MSPRLILGYLQHAQAISAVEQLEAAQTQALPYLKRHDQRRALARLQRAADGLPLQTPAEERAEKQAAWDAAWMRLRGMLGSAGTPPARGGQRLAPGERVVIPPG